jgi:putative membrane protein
MAHPDGPATSSLPRHPVNARHQRHVLTLAAIFAVFVAVSGWQPWYRHDWLLENALVLLAIPVLVAIYRRLPFSRLSWTLVFAFLCLHELGAHYTYAKVPYDEWSQFLAGVSLNELLGWERNNFDRVIHFMYGCLLAYPVREIFLSLASAKGFWGYFLPLDLVLSTSALFELIEWGAAEVFGGELGAAYLGTQGDAWDAHKDMALAGLGALLTLIATALINWRCHRDFAREWADSLTVKRQDA